MELMQRLVPLMAVVFVLSSMLAMGFGLTMGEIIAPLRDVRPVVFIRHRQSKRTRKRNQSRANRQRGAVGARARGERRPKNSLALGH